MGVNVDPFKLLPVQSIKLKLTVLTEEEDLVHNFILKVLAKIEWAQRTTKYQVPNILGQKAIFYIDLIFIEQRHTRIELKIILGEIFFDPQQQPFLHKYFCVWTRSIFCRKQFLLPSLSSTSLK